MRVMLVVRRLHARGDVGHFDDQMTAVPDPGTHRRQHRQRIRDVLQRVIHGHQILRFG